MLLIVLILSFTGLIAFGMYLGHRAKITSPQYLCSHDYVTIQTYSGTLSNEYLSTCKKCGDQTHHRFSGTN